MNQALAVATAHADTRYIAILSSTLKRALETATALREAQYYPKPPLTTSPLLREQYLGEAEGKEHRTVREPDLTLEEHFAQGLYPLIWERHLKFPGGESRNDVEDRANQAIDELLMPYVQDTINMGLAESHIAVVSHGRFIREITDALLRRDAWTSAGSEIYRGVKHLQNTGWARLVVATTNVPQSSRRRHLSVRILDFHRTEHLYGSTKGWDR